jgi:signal peptidase I
MARKPWRSGLWSAMLVVLMGGVWLTFAPTVAGGRSAYVIVAGASMEPTLRRGDLVIARQSAGYQIGDIVTYLHPTVGPVIHRVIAVENGTYTLQGDANTWTDSYHPADDEVLGEAWIHLPRVGSLLTWLRLPPVMGVLALVISVLVVSMVWPRRNDVKPDRENAGRFEAWLSSWAESASTLQFAVFFLGLLVLLGALLAIPAWSRPLTRAAERVFPYTQAGSFSYTARVPEAIYGAQSLQTGQPAYLKLTQRIDFTFEYQFASDSPHALTGSAGLAAEVSDINGWKRGLVLQAPEAFEGDTVVVEGTLDLNVFNGYLQDLEEQTGVTRPYYTLTVGPIIEVNGTLAGLPLAERYSPPLTFLMDSLQLQLAPQDPTDLDADPLRPEQDAALESTAPAPNRITILGASLTVEAARWTSGVALGLGILGLAFLAWGYRRMLQRNPLAAIQLRYGAHLVAMGSGAFELGGATVELASLDDLARVAEKHGRLIFWVVQDGGYDFFVNTGEGLYSFRQAGRAEAPEASADTGSEPE